jgi:hypothetical protein
MELAITIFAWIGLVGTVICVSLTLLVWASWGVRKAFREYTELATLFAGVLFYCRYFLRKGTEMDQGAAYVLLSSFNSLKKSRPAVTNQFEYLLREQTRRESEVEEQEV